MAFLAMTVELIRLTFLFLGYRTKGGKRRSIAYSTKGGKRRLRNRLFAEGASGDWP
jgi:hypothetical protein